VPRAHPKTIGLLSRGTESPAVYAPRNTSCRPLPPGNTCDPHGASGNVGSRRGGIKGSAFSRSSQYLPACRSSFQVFPHFLYRSQLNLRGTPSLPRPRTSRAPSSSPTAGGRPHILHSLVHRCLTSHPSISRVPPHRTRCHHPRFPRLGSPFSRATLCRKQARREAITHKSPSIADETNRLAVDRTTSVSLSVRQTSHLQRWF
jgi:hypothetical protein